MRRVLSALLILVVSAALPSSAVAAMVRRAGRNHGMEAADESVEVLTAKQVASPALAEELEEEGSATSDTGSASASSQNWVEGGSSLNDDDTAGADDLQQPPEVQGVDLETPGEDAATAAPNPPAQAIGQSSGMIGAANPVALRAQANARNTSTASGNTTNSTKALNITVNNHLDPYVCDPPCMEGRGVCNDNICFCMHPYTGSICQKHTEQDDNIRPTHLQLAAICAIAILLGVVIALLIFSCYVEAHTRAQKFGAQEPKKEVWKPAN
mmetsp:Transcript_63888/g.152367  ORF Transcript_63888/g.152367 Transcript_63888/m.152367 type:complete len:269 (+) Transcript_63888:125-931(+)|eukprot:CAMPEP_0178425640 /NCGR_PEP_ID=MMETSP0689_2-20121128/28826_1 /TAXON_ID=160604 /ORGANISM="Amphidinium massartii, Strain CS-259" /LENGTH=268 /DNA_ID=CAMNT_0020047307 /DNA_START=59 /DNA_END=865 /DNA_ORIENTATION=-